MEKKATEFDVFLAPLLKNKLSVAVLAMPILKIQSVQPRKIKGIGKKDCFAK